MSEGFFLGPYYCIQKHTPNVYYVLQYKVNASLYLLHMFFSTQLLASSLTFTCDVKDTIQWPSVFFGTQRTLFRG